MKRCSPVKLSPRLLATAMLLILTSVPWLHAAISPLQAVGDRAKSVVGILSVEAAIYGDKPRGFFDKATGQILVIKKVRPVTYTRLGCGVILGVQGLAFLLEPRTAEPAS